MRPACNHRAEPTLSANSSKQGGSCPTWSRFRGPAGNRYGASRPGFLPLTPGFDGFMRRRLSGWARSRARKRQAGVWKRPEPFPGDSAGAPRPGRPWTDGHPGASGRGDPGSCRDPAPVTPTGLRTLPGPEVRAAPPVRGPHPASPSMTAFRTPHREGPAHTRPHRGRASAGPGPRG